MVPRLQQLSRHSSSGVRACTLAATRHTLQDRAQAAIDPVFNELTASLPDAIQARGITPISFHYERSFLF